MRGRDRGADDQRGDGARDARRSPVWGRFAALAAVLMLGASGCGFVVAQTADPGGPGDALRIVTPAHRTQLASVATVPVTIDVSGIVAGSLQVTLATGGRFGDDTDITGRFTVAGGTASATLGAADLEPGLSYLVARATETGGSTVRRDALWSFEPAVDMSAADRCEFLGQSRCQLPFPSNWFTEADPATDTGRRVAFHPQTFPANTSGVPVDVTELNRNDGFSPGSPIVLLVPGIDLAQTDAAPITDIGRSLDPDQPILLLDAETGERYPFFAELDQRAPSDATRSLVIRPARNFAEGSRVIVALRDLRRADGSVIPASRAFTIYRDQIATFIPEVEGRRAAVNDVLARLDRFGVASGDLYLAWDFTVSSERSLTERALHIRDDALATLDGGAPAFTVATVQDNVSSTVFRRVTGTYSVPKYLTGTGAPGSRFQYAPGAGKDALPVRNGTYQAPFNCIIPRSVAPSATGPVTPGAALVYGHGLLGTNADVSSLGSQANANTAVICGTNWIGMSTEDVPNLAVVLGDISSFPTLADRVQQSFVNQQFLARLMKSPDGLASSAAFRAGSPAVPVVATGTVAFNGNSQGGILGGAATALSTEWTRAVLGVAAMNFSTLLHRSTHWDTFGPISEAAYPDAVDQMVGFGVVQMLWDRAETNGYAFHLTNDPLPGTPPHEVMVLAAFGDHQVANVASETEARTVPGMRVWQPALAPGRSPDVTPQWGIPAVPATPFSGSLLVLWDFGTPAPPPGNVPNRAGQDPHSAGFSSSTLVAQVREFLTGAGFVDLCGGPCQG